MARSYAVGGLIALVALGAVEARAQTDLNAGMTPAQLFAANCADATGLRKGWRAGAILTPSRTSCATITHRGRPSPWRSRAIS